MNQLELDDSLAYLFAINNISGVDPGEVRYCYICVLWIDSKHTLSYHYLD